MSITLTFESLEFDAQEHNMTTDRNAATDQRAAFKIGEAFFIIQLRRQFGRLHSLAQRQSENMRTLRAGYEYSCHVSLLNIKMVGFVFPNEPWI